MPIEPVDPSKKTSGDGSEKYTPNEKRGPSEFDKSLEKEKADRVAERQQIRKMGEALDKAGVPLPKRDTFPKTTAAFEEIERSDAERAARKAEKARAEIKEYLEKGPKPGPKAYSDTGPRTGPTSGGFGGGGGGGAGIPKVGPRKPTEMKKGGRVSSASKRADGCAIRGKTRA